MAGERPQWVVCGRSAKGEAGEVADVLRRVRFPGVDAKNSVEWRGAARWLSLGVAGFYLLGAAPLVLGWPTVDAAVSMFMGLIVGAATLTGNPKLPLGMTALVCIQAVGLVVMAFGDTAPPRLILQLALLTWSVLAAIALWNAHQISAA